MVRGGASASPAGREFEIAYVDAESGERRLALIDVWWVPFEECMPVRGFPSYKGQRNHVGRWWTATTGSLVGYESWLERDWLMLLDFDPDVVGIAAQPFWLLWTTPEGKPCSHAPDYFARSAGLSRFVHGPEMSRFRRVRVLSVFDEVDEWLSTAGVGPRGTARSGATCVVAGCRCDGLIWPHSPTRRGGCDGLNCPHLTVITDPDGLDW